MFHSNRHRQSVVHAMLLGALACWSLLMPACGGGSVSSARDGGGADGPPSSAQATIGTAGGTVSLPGGAQVVIPEGALAADATIGIEQTAEGAPPLPSGAKTFGPIFAFTPHGIHFARPAMMTVPFDAASVPPGTKLALAKTSASMTAWDVLGGTVGGNTLSGPVDGFSYATVLEDPNPVTDPPHLVTETWHFEEYFTGSSDPFEIETDVLPSRQNADRELRDEDPNDAADIVVFNEWQSDVADGRVYSNQLGNNFWAEAVAPANPVDQVHQKIGRSSTLTINRVLRKTDAAASLKAVIDSLILEHIDANATEPLGAECPWLYGRRGAGDPCGASMVAEAAFKLDVWHVLPNGGILSLRHVDSSVRLHGWRNHWRIEAGSTPESDEPLFQNVTYKVDAARSGDTEGAVVSAPNREDTIPTIDVPVDEVMVGDDLNVRVTLTVAVLNRRQSESFAGATLRDLASGSGVRLEEQGLEVVRAQARQAPEPPPPALPLPAAACATGVDPAAGSIHLEMDSIDGFEQAGARALIRVVRSGGGKGAASVVFSTSDGTARAGVDYTPVTTVVRFDDGEQGGRLVTIPIADNAAPDGDRTVMLSLTQPMGCAALGAPSTATLVIHDDDTPAPATTAFHLGGTITGLAGSGLVLADVVNGSVVMPAADGAFVFPVTLIDGGSYDVGVQAQPQNPAQSCTVSRGHGKIAGADVTDIAVSCTTLPSNGALDPTFGAAGKVSASLAAPSAVALQPDGKILTVGDMTLSRFNADGSIDAAFGTAGSVTLVASGGPVDALVALSIQADGKIVVAGNTSLPTSINDNFVVARFDAAGRPDGTFGTTGQVVTDFNGLYDRATAVLVQPDQKTVAAGGATSGSLSAGDQDFALVRYLPGGDLDSTFGVGGKATLNVAGNADFGNTAALQADGKILVAGRVFANGSSSADIGVARVNADGTLDKAFGVAGVARVSFDGGTGDVAKLVVQPDGKIVIAGSSATGGVSCYAMVRLAIDGSLDAAFGTHGQVSTPFTTEQDYATSVALLADGRIVVAGELASYDKNSDMGLARYTSSGALDPSFGTGGLLRIDLFGDVDGAYDLVVQPDGRIVAAGLGRNGPGGGLALVRVLP